MKCKPGDIAMSLYTDNYGRLCRVVKPSPHALFADWKVVTLESWVLETVSPNCGVVTPLRPMPAGTVAHCLDRHLKPLRPGDDADETLSWARLPKPVEVEPA